MLNFGTCVINENENLNIGTLALAITVSACVKKRVGSICGAEMPVRPNQIEQPYG